VRTLVTFESTTFNTKDSREHFINPNNFGDDVAQWLVGRLRNAGLQVDEKIGQEDFGWYLEFQVPEGQHCVIVGFRPDDPAPGGCWIAWLERSRGLVASLLGGRKRGIAGSAVLALHAALQAPEIRNVRWHEQKDFDALREELGTPTP
jgi:hypothetical protein